MTTNVTTLTRTAVGESPLSLSVARSYLKLPSSLTADDALINIYIDAVTDWCELYTSREVRPNTWKLLLDFFDERISLCKNPVNAVTSVKYIYGGTQLTFSSANYYLKLLDDGAEILTKSNVDWPAIDDIEQAVEVVYTTKAIDKVELIKSAMLQHVAFLYRNRGDHDVGEAAKLSGAMKLYNMVAVRNV